MDSEPTSPSSDFCLDDDRDWEYLHEILTGETSSKSDEVQFPQNANNFQGCGSTTSNTSLNPMSLQMDVSRGSKQPVPKKRYSHEEYMKLIQGVEKYKSRYCRWEFIKKKYFADSNRSASQLKHAWKHIMKKNKMEDLKEHPMRELYIKAQKADDAKRATEKMHRR